MKKLIFTPLVLGLSLVPAFGADPVVNSPVAPPSNVAAPATNPPIGDAQQTRLIVPLRTLRVVLDARERRVPWQQGADYAVARIANPALASNARQQLASLAPQVAAALMQQPGENAIVTVAVYKERGSDKQILAGVAYEGVGDDLNPSFYSRVLANFPQVPGVKQDLAERLEFDPVASSYLCFFLDHGDLKADNITHAQMKKSLDLGIEQARQAANVAAAPLPPANQPEQAAVNPPVQSPGVVQSQNGQDWTTPYWANESNEYVPYYGVDGWIPWYSYVPAFGQPAVIVNPDFHHRERWLRHDREEHQQAVTAEQNQQAQEARAQNSVINSARPPAENLRLILPRAPRERGPLPVAPDEPQGPLQGARDPQQELRQAPARETGPARGEAPPRAETAPRRAEAAPVAPRPAPAGEPGAPARK